LKAQAIRTWSGTEGYLPDRQPVIGHSSMQPGLLHAFGFAGAGFQIGPAVGQALTEIICSGASKTPLDAFSITRFHSISVA
jgi:sarcosine oxidase subunit beta